MQQGGAQLLRMSLPLYDPVEAPPAAAAPGSALVKACIGDLALQEARWGGLHRAGQPSRRRLPAERMPMPMPRCAALRRAAPRRACCRYVSKDNLCYVLLVLGDGVSRAQLEALAPDVAAMHAAASAEQVHGVIVSTAGAEAAAAAAAAGG